MTRRSDEAPDAALTARQRPRRPRDGVRRPHSLTVALSDQELAQLDAGSRREDLALGAYVAVAAVAHATVQERPVLVGGELVRRLAVTADEATRAWRTLRVVGGLLNQVAKTGNSTGALPPNTPEAVARVAQAVEHVDTTATTLHALSVELSDSLRRPAARRGTRR